MLTEGGLHGMQRAAVGHAFNGGDLLIFRLHGEQRTGFYWLAVQVHGACAALAGIAADVGAGEAQLFAQDVNQQRARLDVDRVRGSVDGERNLHAGLASLAAARAPRREKNSSASFLAAETIRRPPTWAILPPIEASTV